MLGGAGVPACDLQLFSKGLVECPVCPDMFLQISIHAD